MKRVMIGCGIFLVIFIIAIIAIFGMGWQNYNRMVELKEEVNNKWAQVENQYQRRFDLIPNLVQTVKGYAAHEKETFENISEARAKAGGVFNMSEEVLNNPQAFQKFQQAQSGLGSALQRLMVVQERYPDLKANQNFIALQNQLEGTENRISVERKRFNDTAKNYNVFIKRLPQAIFAKFFGHQEVQYFQSSAGAESAPEVNFE